MKICKECSIEKEIDLFIKDRRVCKICYAVYENYKYEKNKAVILTDRKSKYDSDAKKEYYKTNKERYKLNNKVYKRMKRDTDPLYRLKENIKGGIRQALKRNGYKKHSKTADILGCSYIDFKIYIEKQFEDWMTWENKGLYEKDKYNVGWDIDHIIPLSNASNEAELIKLCHYTNLQPLCSKINRDIKKAI